MHGRFAAEARRDLDQRLVDDDSQRVEVGGVCLTPEALSFERDCAAAGEGVEHGGLHAVVGVENRLSRLAVQIVLVNVVP